MQVQGFKVCSSNETTATVRYTQQTINVDRVENDHQALLRLVSLFTLQLYRKPWINFMRIIEFYKQIKFSSILDFLA